MSASIVRAALTQTRNTFSEMPEREEDLDRLRGRLDEIRRANVEHHVDLVSLAAQMGCRIAGFGELFTSPYFALGRNPLWFDLAEDAERGPTITRLREVARERQMVLVAPIYELEAPSGRRFNTAVVIDADGSLCGRYRKLHIPQGSNERGSFHETFYYERSDGQPPAGYFPVFPTAVGPVAVATCYDRHFEGVVRRLAGQGAAIVFSPAVTFGDTSRRMWDLEFPVDALRHRVYLGGSNRLGSEPPWNVEFFGKSYFCGPGGRLPDLSRHSELIVSDLDLGALDRESDSGWNLARDRRDDIWD